TKLASVWFVRGIELVNTGMPLNTAPGSSPIQPAARSCTFVPAVGLVLIQVAKTSFSPPAPFALMLGRQSDEVLEAAQRPAFTKVWGLTPILKSNHSGVAKPR